jgi:pantothenate kinase-related protein Tda10
VLRGNLPISNLPLQAAIGTIELVDSLELVKLFHELFEGVIARDVVAPHAFRSGKEAQKPLFIVLFGPPGSGKTQIVHKLLKAYYGKLKVTRCLMDCKLI